MSNLPTNDGIVKTAKEFSGALTLDLTDEEIARALKIVMRVKQKHQEIFRKKYPFDSLEQALELIANFEDEIKTELAERCNVLATIDTVPMLEGKPMNIEWIGKLPGDALYKYGMDHEKKEWEVKRANVRGEDYLGQKE